MRSARIRSLIRPRRIRWLPMTPWTRILFRIWMQTHPFSQKLQTPRQHQLSLVCYSVFIKLQWKLYLSWFLYKIYDFVKSSTVFFLWNICKIDVNSKVNFRCFWSFDKTMLGTIGCVNVKELMMFNQIFRLKSFLFFLWFIYI